MENIEGTGAGWGSSRTSVGPMGQRLHTRPACACAYLAVQLGLSKCGGPEGQGRAQVSLKLARGVKSNKDFTDVLVASRSPGWFLLFKSPCKPWDGLMRPTKMSTVLQTVTTTKTLAQEKKKKRLRESGCPKVVIEKVKILSSQGSTVITGNGHKLLQREIPPGLRKSSFTMRTIVCPEKLWNIPCWKYTGMCFTEPWVI